MKDMTLLVPVYVSILLLTGCVSSQRDSLGRLKRSVEIIAHRGASHVAPENTLAAVGLAWELGADAVEVDVHLSADQRIVAIHDPSTGRTAGKSFRVADVDSLSLRRLDVGRHKDREFAGAQIPFLEEVLTTVPAGRRLFVEVKCGPEILPALDAVFAASGKRHQMVVIGFELATMERSKQVMPDVPAYWLCDTFLGAPFGRGLVARAVAAGVDGVNVQFSGVTTRFATVVRNAGLEFYTWTVDRPIDALRLQQLGVNGITTNRPGWLRERLSGPAMLAESRATAGAAPAPRS